MNAEEWADLMAESLDLGGTINTQLLKDTIINADTAVLRNAIPKLDLTGKSIMDTDDDEETGIDLSKVPMCVRCGLEMANSFVHEQWHAQQESQLTRMEETIHGLERTIQSLIATVQAANSPDRYGRVPSQPWISDDEIRKYGNPYKQTPKYKSGEKWDKT